MSLWTSEYYNHIPSSYTTLMEVFSVTSIIDSQTDPESVKRRSLKIEVILMYGIDLSVVAHDRYRTTTSHSSQIQYSGYSQKEKRKLTNQRLTNPEDERDERVPQLTTLLLLLLKFHYYSDLFVQLGCSCCCCGCCCNNNCRHWFHSSDPF
jgi:hypothetical protein